MEFNLSSQPLAYFLTWTAYGAWLHGREKGSVEKSGNLFGTPVLPPDPILEAIMLDRMIADPYELNEPRRNVVLDTLLEVAQYRRWNLIAAHIRSTHVHVVVQSMASPEKIMSDFKAYSSRRLSERLEENKDTKRWTQHGSTRYLWTEDQISEAVEYTLERQGTVMNRYGGRNSA